MSSVISYEDRTEILDLMSRYSHYIDGGQAKAWAELFLPDGEFHLIVDAKNHYSPWNKRLKGHEQLMHWMSKEMVYPTTGPILHFVGTSYLVKMPNGTVRGRSKAFSAFDHPNRKPDELNFPVVVSGEYSDEFVKT